MQKWFRLILGTSSLRVCGVCVVCCQQAKVLTLVRASSNWECQGGDLGFHSLFM